MAFEETDLEMYTFFIHSISNPDSGDDWGAFYLEIGENSDKCLISLVNIWFTILTVWALGAIEWLCKWRQSFLKSRGKYSKIVKHEKEMGNFEWELNRPTR